MYVTARSGHLGADVGIVGDQERGGAGGAVSGSSSTISTRGRGASVDSGTEQP
jgi:hypothetical protein